MYVGITMGACYLCAASAAWNVMVICVASPKVTSYIIPPQAADMLRVTGIGRNEYIALMNACKAKRLLWRVNKGIARDLLPAAPLDVKMEPWWGVQVVNVGECSRPRCGQGILHACFILLHAGCILRMTALNVSPITRSGWHDEQSTL